MPNFLADDLRNTGKFDLIINTGSFGEMNKGQITQYAEIMDNLLDDDGIVYEENGDSDLHPIINILSKKFSCFSYHKNNRNRRLWVKNKDILSKMKMIEDYRPSILKTPYTWLQWRIKRTQKKWRRAW